jgi:serine/threonine-protein kinase
VTDEAALSRKLVARAVDGSAHLDDNARALLQKRLEVYCRVMFWAFVVLRALEVLLYASYPQVKPQLYSWIFTTGIVGLVPMAVCWRALVVRRTLSLRVLSRVDLAYTALSGVVFGATALLAWDRRESAYTCLVYACFVVFMRALVVPSGARWTAKVSTISFAPLVIAAAALALCTDQEVPGPAYFACAFLYSAMAVTIATAGSRFIYGLRRRVRERARLGQYTIDHKIGEGRMGTVYRARHALLRRPTALKLFRPERIGGSALDRFEREVQHMSELTHPNTVAVFDYGHSPEGFYFAMEFLDGIDLEKLVRSHGPQPLGRAIDILVQVCGALHEAHLRGLCHRDLKPANIILCERGGMPDVAKVGDFGLACEHGDVAGDIRDLGAVATFLVSDASRREVEALIERRPESAAALARELRALPCDGSWDPGAARTWWRSFRADASVPAATPSQLSITVDLDARR